MRRHGLSDSSAGGAGQQADLVGDHLNGLSKPTGSQHATHEDQLGIRNIWINLVMIHLLCGNTWDLHGFTFKFTVSVYLSYSTKMHKAIEEVFMAVCVYHIF